MSWQATTWAVQQRTGDPAMKLLLLTIANYADEYGECWPTQKRLAFDAEISGRSVIRKLTALQAAGFLTLSPRFDAKGRQLANVIQLNVSEPTWTACHPGGGDTAMAPPGVTLESPLNKLPEEHPKDSPAKPQEGAGKPKEKKPKVERTIYSERFEEQVWKPYPRKEGTSKKAAYVKFEMLSDADQELVIGTIPTYCKLKAGKDQDKIHHLEFFLSKRIFDTISISKAAVTVKFTDYTRKQWEGVLAIWRQNYTWREHWGPAPGKDGCGVPDGLLFEREKFQIEKFGVAG